MDISSTITTIITKIAGDLLSSGINILWNRKEDFELSLENHLIEVAKWTESIQFFGMSSSLDIDTTTIDLSISSEPRRFFKNSNTQLLSESDLLINDKSYLLLGDPGSGKTTTIKRIARTLLLNAPESENDIYQVPLIIRLVKLNKPLFFHFADILGFSGKIKKGPKYKSINPKTNDMETNQDYFIGKLKLENTIYNCLNKLRAVVLIDGLDEVDRNFRVFSNLENDIELISQNINSAKIIVTCRSGDISTQWEDFDFIEIEPLKIDQIKSIVQKWTDKADNFLASIEKLPYKDIVDRPLFLTQLLFVYKKTNYLPQQPSRIYDKMVHLMLEAWDQERRILRKSKYAEFNPARKLEFLSAISYQLTYKIQKKVFSSSDLVQAYSAVCRSFALPKSEASQVASEIETHTGLIVKSGNSYEFSHLSLQEYLCANYVVRSPYADKMESYLKYYPAPIAICIALSSEPTAWFSNIILNKKYYIALIDGDKITSFIKRMIVEKPYFVVSEELGFAVIKLFLHDSIRNIVPNDGLDILLSIKEAKESASIVLKHYGISAQQSNIDNIFYYIRLINKNIFIDKSLDIKDSGFIKRRIISSLVDTKHSKISKFISLHSNETRFLKSKEYNDLKMHKDIK